MYFVITKYKPTKNEPTKLRMITMIIRFWILTWQGHNAYHTFENQKPVLDSFEEKEVSVPPPT